VEVWNSQEIISNYYNTHSSYYFQAPSTSRLSDPLPREAQVIMLIPA
jgi:hypothetical protein